MSLIIIATICMTWSLRHWTAISRRRAVLSLVISLSACWITALACIEGMARREGVFLRTSKTGAGQHRLRKALRLTRWEILLSVSLYAAAGLIAASAHPPVLLVFIISLQGTVYACSPIASLWNLRAQLAPAGEFRRRYERRLGQARNRRPSFRLAGLAAALVLAVIVGAAAASLAAPNTLLPGNMAGHGHGRSPVRPAASPQQAASEGSAFTSRQ
jgi:hypothetical protein